jgi:hypothetical protein
MRRGGFKAGTEQDKTNLYIREEILNDADKNLERVKILCDASPNNCTQIQNIRPSNRWWLITFPDGEPFSYPDPKSHRYDSGANSHLYFKNRKDGDGDGDITG